MSQSKRFHIGVVGLGLMGASLALALRGFRSARLSGADLNEKTCQRAMEDGVVDEAAPDVGSVMARADLLIFCVYAHHIPQLLNDSAKRLKKGCVVSDICGVKTNLYAQIMPMLPEHIDYVGVHPMAGKECDGYENAEAALYRGTGFLITPTIKSTEASIDLMKELANYIGAARVQVVPPEEHDEIIAYTSDLMHIAAAGLCVRPHPGTHPAFTAGAFRDSTRVADINAGAWTELLMDNRGNTVAALDQYLRDLSEIRGALNQGDREALRKILLRAGENKRRLKGM